MLEHPPGVSKGTNRLPTGHSIRTHLTERGMTYGGRPLWSRSHHSSQRVGKPRTRRRMAGSSTGESTEVCEMQSANIVLTIIRERGSRGLPLERVYRMLFNRELYLRAYARLYPNKGAMTQGITSETVDGMSQVKIDRLIEDLRHERFRWTPVRRVYIAKRNGRQRPLGIPTWKDKLLQEVMRSILEAYYEPQLSELSHGFRPGRGCHTALTEIQQVWTGTRWFIEGDISKYFDTINHDILINTLKEKILDNRFLRLIRELLQAGYLEDWKYHKTLSGAPQGGVISPILSNIYLDRFDQYIEKELIPAYTRGKQRRWNPVYKHISHKLARARKTGQKVAAKELRKQQRQLPSRDPNDPSYRRLRYIRYADDYLLGFAGPRHEAEEIKQAIATYLHTTLDLQPSNEKTLITSATTQHARFLGYHIVNQQADDKIEPRQRRSVNGQIGLRVPPDVLAKKCAQYMKDGKPTHRPEMMAGTDFSIITRYQQEYRGIVQYYLLAFDVSCFWRLHWVMRSSLLKTLAAKHKTSTAAIRAKYQRTTRTPTGESLNCLEAHVERDGKPDLIAQFGGIPLQRQPRVGTVLDDHPYVHKNERTEILKRLLADECELCGSTINVEVHHIRKLADLRDYRGKERPEWVKQMATRQRKTLVVCRDCHQNIHAGRPTRQRVPK